MKKRLPAPRDRWLPERQALPGAAATVAGFGLVAGPTGAVAGLLLDALLPRIGGIYFYVLAHLLLLPLVPDPSPIELALLETPLLLALTGEEKLLTENPRHLATLILVPLTLLTWSTYGPAAAALLLSTLFGATAYLIHRLEMLKTGKLGESG